MESVDQREEFNGLTKEDVLWGLDLFNFLKSIQPEMKKALDAHSLPIPE